MSHFVVYVLIPEEPKTERDAEEAIAELLAPYDENTQVEPYERDCYCLGREARKVAREKGEEKFPREMLRAQFQATCKAQGLKLPENPWEDSEDEDKIDEIWASTCRPREAYEKMQYASHPKADKPEPDCDECGGTGQEQTQYNPKSKWDWYQIGGRWNGALGSYDPYEDPANWEICRVCAGTGKRAPAPKTGPGDQPCNGCESTGKSLKWPTQQVQKDNVAPAAKVLAVVKEKGKSAIPYAMVTPDAEWHAQGTMGWFGITIEKHMKKEKWADTVIRLLTENPESWVVVVDCHI